MERALPDKRTRLIGGRVFSIAPDTPFLKELAAALVDGRLVRGFRPLDDPLALARATVYLPTRRAARVFSAEIIAALGGGAALLPQIRTLGDSDEDELALAFLATEEAKLPPACSRLERQLQLGRLVRGWTTALSQATRELFGDEDIIIPSSAADALKLAGDLARLLDQMETEEIQWAELEGLVGAEHAKWWELTLAFLTIVTRHWPQYLAETGRLDPAAARRGLLDLRTKQLEGQPPAGPVIAAGSTGSIPATARLLGAIAGLEQGAIVLPGVDFELPEPVWQQLSRPPSPDIALTLSTHPQFGLARLLDQLGVRREVIERLGEDAEKPRGRMTALSLAMLPAPETGTWPKAEAGARWQGAEEDIAVIEAPGEREEALAVAIAMREALETPGRTAALTTPDRPLARRVVAELGRFGVRIDDSAGIPLNETPAGRLVRLLLAVATQPADPVTLAAFVKALAAATPDAFAPQLASRFELGVLRGAAAVPQAGRFEAAVHAAKSRVEQDRFAADVAKAMSDADWAGLGEFARHADRSFEPLLALGSPQGGIPPATAFAAARQAISRLLRDPDGARLLDLAGGRELVHLFDQFDAIAPDRDGAIALPHGELPEIFLALCRDIVVRDVRQPHPRLHIWGPLEARLQSVDLMILSGLNEGRWPAAVRNDPFLNRPMKGDIGLSFPERRVGQSAHDFTQLCGAPQLILTRALKADNAPTVASRWLQRLMTIAGKENRDRMRKSGARYLRLAQAIDGNGAAARRAARPCPRPPLALRPNSLSITEIETWIRDPYAIHARHVLGLRPLPPLEREADPALRGVIYHEVLARFVTGRMANETAKEAAQRMEHIARHSFAGHEVPEEVALTWLPRLLEIGRLFIAWEAGRQPAPVRSLCEVAGRIEVGDTGFVLRGRADRIDVMADATTAIFDYKTSLSPSARQARVFSPQLSLEAGMAQSGAFGPQASGTVGDLAYVRLRPGAELRIDRVASDKEGESTAELAARAWSELTGLIAAYRDPAQGYLSRYAVMREGEVQGDYDHLARVREWSVGEASGEDGDD